MTPEALTPAWLGRLPGLAGVTGLALRRIGQASGFSGCRLYRLTLAPGGARVVAKFSPAAPAALAAMAAANAREVAFYRGGAAGLPAPACHFAACDPATGASLLILQDLGGWRAGSFRRGLGPAQAGLALAALAQGHARHWGRIAEAGGSLQAAYPFDRLWPAYLDRLGRPLPAAIDRLGTRIAADPPRALARLAGTVPPTLCHGDPQADNLRFGGGGEVLLIDWQMAGPGPGLADVGYLLASSLEPATRRRHEAALVARWRAGLAARGVADGGAAAGYALAAVGKLWITVAATLFFDNRGAARQRWRQVDLDRLAAFCDDHDPAALL